MNKTELLEKKAYYENLRKDILENDNQDRINQEYQAYEEELARLREQKRAEIDKKYRDMKASDLQKTEHYIDFLGILIAEEEEKENAELERLTNPDEEIHEEVGVEEETIPNPLENL